MTFFENHDIIIIEKKKGGIIMELIIQLCNSIKQAVKDDKRHLENPRCKDGTASWSSAGYLYSRIYKCSKLSAEAMRNLYYNANLQF